MPWLLRLQVRTDDSSICIEILVSGLLCLAPSVSLALYLMTFKHCFSTLPILKPSSHDAGVSSHQMLQISKAYLNFTNYSASPIVPLRPSLCLLESKVLTKVTAIACCSTWETQVTVLILKNAVMAFIYLYVWFCVVFFFF